MAVMPCCYTGTDASSSDGSNTEDMVVVPFGVRRLFGVVVFVKRDIVIVTIGVVGVAVYSLLFVADVAVAVAVLRLLLLRYR